MPGWFTPVIVVLAVVALVFLVAYWTTRKRKHLVGLGVSLVLIGVVWLIASGIPTDQRAIESALREMAAGVKNRNPDQVFEHIAEDFHFGPVTRATFKQLTESPIRSGAVQEITFWEYEPEEISREAKKAKVRFYFKPFGATPDDAAYFLCRATFVLESDDKWRMQSFEYFNPFVNTKTPLGIPGIN